MQERNVTIPYGPKAYGKTPYVIRKKKNLSPHEANIINVTMCKAFHDPKVSDFWEPQLWEYTSDDIHRA